MTKLPLTAVLLSAAVLSACEKNAVQDITRPVPNSAIKFFHFGVNAPGVYFYADDDKVTAVATAVCSPPTDPACETTGLEPTTGTAYTGAGSGGLYNGLPAGQYDFSARIAATTDKGLAIASVPLTIEEGKYYSYYLSGFYDATTKQSDVFVVEDALPAIDYEVAYVRFVNAIGNSSPMTLYGTNTTEGTAEVAIGGEVAYKSAGAFTAITPGTYNLAARTAGSSTNAIARTGVSFSEGRVYTITARGDITVTSTTATNRPFLDNTANR